VPNFQESGHQKKSGMSVPARNISSGDPENAVLEHGQLGALCKDVLFCEKVGNLAETADLIDAYVCMYVYMYVCVRVCVVVCMYVCMYVYVCVYCSLRNLARV
jgi:hypothetical protein